MSPLQILLADKRQASSGLFILQGDDVFRRHPSGLYPLFFTEMWERFSFYTMAALLTLYMDAPKEEGGLGFDKAVTAQIYGLYNGFVYFTPLFGGLLADKFWGFVRTVSLGGAVMMFGHLSLAGEGLAFFFLGLALIIIGNGLFKPNISAMLGHLYRERPELKDQGFNIFYMGINLGALIAPLTANWLKNGYGWHAGFGSAAVGMVLSLIVFLAYRRVVSGADEAPSGPRPTAVPVSPEVERQRLRALLIIFAVVALFWMAFKQNGLTLTRWARDHTSPFMDIDFQHNASLTLAINPALVLLLTPPLVLFWEFLKKRGMEVSTPRKMALGMVLTAACFGLMGVGGLQLDNNDQGRVSVVWLVSGYVLVTLAELCVSPMGLSVVSKLAPPRLSGLLMGGWFVATSVGVYMAGAVGAYWNEWSHSTFFFVLVGSSLFAALLLFVLLGKLEAVLPIENPKQKNSVPADDKSRPPALTGS